MDSEPSTTMIVSVLREEMRSSLNLLLIPLILISAIATGVLLKLGEDILVPFIVAIFFSYLLSPLVNWLSRPLGSQLSSIFCCCCTHYVRSSLGSCQGHFFNANNNTSNSGGGPNNTNSSSLNGVSIFFKESFGFINASNNPSVSSGIQQQQMNSGLGMPPPSTTNNSKRQRRRYDLFSCSQYGYWGEIVDRVLWKIGSLRLPRVVAVFVSLLMVLGVFVGLVVMVTDAVQSFEENNMALYEERMVELASKLLIWLKSTFGVDGTHLLQSALQQFQVVSLTKNFLVTLMDAVAYTFLVMLFTCYMLLEEPATSSSFSSSSTSPLSVGDVDSVAAYSAVEIREKDDDDYENETDIRDGSGIATSDEEDDTAADGKGNSLPSSSLSGAAFVRRQIDHQIQVYLVTKTLISVIVGFLTYLILGPMLQVEMAHVFGTITFIANYIPYVGALMATLLPLPVVALDANQTLLSIFLSVALPTSVHAVVGNVVEPKIFGRQLELHPVVVMISLSFWFSIWGVSGAILSVPITAVIRIILSHISHPYAHITLRLLEGNLPGSPGFHRQHLAPTASNTVATSSRTI